MTDWATVSIPANMKERIQELIDSEQIYFTSVGEFTRSAIREKLKRIEERIE